MKRAIGRKNLMAVAVLTLVMSMGLAACSGAATNSGASDKAAPAADTSAKNDNTANAGAANLKPYTLTLYYPGTPQPDQKLVEEKMSEYLKGKINASIQIKPIDWGAWNDKMNLLVASGEQADIIFTASWNGHSTNV
ncbi:sugar ABC transporter substrate-binding protein, partial [Paenibacillus sp. TAF58]